MQVYTYKARDLNGLLVVGKMEGDSPDPIKEKLAERGLIPLQVTKGNIGSLNSDLSLDFLKSVTGQELMLFTRQFSTLFKAGMDIETLLDTLGRQTKNSFFSDAIQRVKSDVASGSSLSRAFSQHPKVFTELYTSMIATGEEAGILDQVMDQLANVLEKEQTLKSSVKSATLYPKIVVFVLFMASIVIMTYVVPQFASFYAHYDAELPLATRIMMGTSHIFVNYWYMCLIAIACAMFAFHRWQKTASGRLLWDKIKWKVPVFGPLGQKVANARFANILGALYKSGLPITRALEITSNTIGHEVYCRSILDVKAEVEKGNSISDAMRRAEYFNPLLIEATAIGEKSGALDEMYFSIGAHYDTEVQHTLKNLTTLIEPMLLFVVFGMVAVFALAIFLPMWNMSEIVL